jgi:hypothetical protein
VDNEAIRIPFDAVRITPQRSAPDGATSYTVETIHRGKPMLRFVSRVVGLGESLLIEGMEGSTGATFTFEAFRPRTTT